MTDDDKLDPANLPRDLRVMADLCDTRASQTAAPVWRHEYQDAAETLRAAADEIERLRLQLSLHTAS